VPTITTSPTLTPTVPTLTPTVPTLTLGFPMAPSTIAPVASLRVSSSWAGGQAQSLASVELAGVRSRSSNAWRKSRRSPVSGMADGQPAPFQTTPAGSGVGSSATGGSGLVFFDVAGLLALFALAVPGLTCLLRLAKEVGTPAPFVLLLDRPG
jgi:hypothetical protein